MPRVIEGKVLAEGTRRAAALFDFPHHGVGVGFLLGRTGMMDRHPRAGACQGERDRPADFAASAGDQSGPVWQQEAVECVGQHDGS